MRTTVTLDADVARALKRLMEQRGLSFKAALNSALRRGLGEEEPGHAEFPTFDLGEPTRDLTFALRVAAELEDDEIVREMSTGR